MIGGYNLERVNKIVSHRAYVENIDKLFRAEENRVFCRHNLQHFLDVARVGYIIALERKFKIGKEIIYAASLLHDIGRWKQYQDGTDHAIYSAGLAQGILIDCGFKDEEIVQVIESIEKHRKGINLTTELDIALYEGDKLSRPCVECQSLDGCDRFSHDQKPKLVY
jgi:uncharacterized protein